MQICRNSRDVSLYFAFDLSGTISKYHFDFLWRVHWKAKQPFSQSLNLGKCCRCTSFRKREGRTKALSCRGSLTITWCATLLQREQRVKEEARGAGSVRINQSFQKRLVWPMHHFNFDDMSSFEPVTQLQRCGLYYLMEKYASFRVNRWDWWVKNVDLVESFPTSIFLQNLASMQPRTSLWKAGIWTGI